MSQRQLKPTEPGIYWAKLKTPTYFDEANTAGEDWVSQSWELVEVFDNNGEGDEEFAVNVFGVPVTQWPEDFYWGHQVRLLPPKGDA